MLLSSAPEEVKRNFSSELAKFTDSDKFVSVKRYYDSMRAAMAAEPKMHFYRSIEDRTVTSRYFYFPTEAPLTATNCFERSASVYFAFAEVYPESNPAILVNENPWGAIHNSVLFTHQHETWIADPNYGHFGKVRFLDDRLVTMNETGEETSSAVKHLSQMDEHSLQTIVHNLRKPSGILDFLYKSGQVIASSDMTGMLETSLFMRVQPDQYIRGDIRMHEIGEEKSASRRSIEFNLRLNPITYRSCSGLSRCKGFAWTGIIDPEYIPELSAKTPSKVRNLPFEDGGHIAALEDVVFYCLDRLSRKNPSIDKMVAFEMHPIIQDTLKPQIDLAEKIDGRTKMEFLRYLMKRYGPAERVQTIFGESCNAELRERYHLSFVPMLLKMWMEKMRHVGLIMDHLKSPNAFFPEKKSLNTQ